MQSLKLRKNKKNKNNKLKYKVNNHYQMIQVMRVNSTSSNNLATHTTYMKIKQMKTKKKILIKQKTTQLS